MLLIEFGLISLGGDLWARHRAFVTESLCELSIFDTQPFSTLFFSRICQKAFTIASLSHVVDAVNECIDELTADCEQAAQQLS
jgi:hypothetical protein